MKSEQERADKRHPRLIETLRFRLTFLFLVCLTGVSVAVLSFLLGNVKKDLLNEIDLKMLNRMESITSFIEDEVIFSDYEGGDDDARGESVETIDTDSLYGMQYKLSESSNFSPLKKEVFIFEGKEKNVLLNISPIEAYKKIAMTDIQPHEPGEFHNLKVNGLTERFRVTTYRYKDLYSVTLLVPLDNFDQQYHRLQISFFSAAGVLVVLGGGLCWWIVSGSMKGVKLVSNAADHLGSGDLKRRVDCKGQGSEIEQLAGSFNSMADQIESLIHEMKDVTNNVAHDLRTPVTRMRGISENFIGCESDEAQELAAIVIEECEHQSAIIEDILSLSESESGVLELNKSEVLIDEILRDIVELYEPVARNNGCLFALQGDVSVRATIDKNRFQRAIANIIDNAIKYSCGEIKIELIKAEGHFSVRIKDHGEGVPESIKADIFKRFFRADSSRNTEGSGLGLSLAKAYIQNHCGDIILEETHAGASFRVDLPL